MCVYIYVNRTMSTVGRSSANIQPASRSARACSPSPASRAAAIPRNQHHSVLPRSKVRPQRPSSPASAMISDRQRGLPVSGLEDRPGAGRNRRTAMAWNGDGLRRGRPGTRMATAAICRGELGAVPPTVPPTQGGAPWREVKWTGPINPGPM